MVNALRLHDGVELSLFEERAGIPLVAALAGLNEAVRRGLAERDHERVRPTALGQRFLNDLLQIFLPADTLSDPQRIATMTAVPRVNPAAATNPEGGNQ